MSRLIIFRVVVLPQPDGPTSTTISPSVSAKVVAPGVEEGERLGSADDRQSEHAVPEGDASSSETTRRITLESRGALIARSLSRARGRSPLGNALL
jgi:hypothetical protein